MADQFENKIVDKYLEHIFHVKNEADCSTCFKENRLINAFVTVNKDTAEFENEREDSIRSDYSDEELKD